jgi:hypothetical protein
VQVIVDKLRSMCLDERVDKNGVSNSYSALTQDPKDWSLEPGKPCGGERY